jgi:hypothetical protein
VQPFKSWNLKGFFYGRFFLFVVLELRKGGNVMRTGVIVYVVGETPVQESIDIGAEVKRLQPETDRVEIVSGSTGQFDIEDAWWSLTAKGMQRIICMIGEMNAAGGIQLKEKTLRLCG